MKTKLTQRSQRVTFLAKLLGYNGPETSVKEADAFMGKLLGLQPSSITRIRWKYKFSAGNSATLLEMLGDKAQHIPDLSTYLTLDANGKALPADPKAATTKRKRKAKKGSRKSGKKAATTPKPTVVKAETVAPAAPKAVATPRAVVASTAPATEVPRSSGTDFLVTQVQHGGAMYQAILVPLGLTVSITCNVPAGAKAVITVQ